MYDHAELSYFRRFLEKLRIQSHIFTGRNVPSEKIDLGLRKYLGREQEYIETIRQLPLEISENTIYKITDSYACSYIFFLMPNTEEDVALVLGPYLSQEMETEILLQKAEQLGIPAADFHQLEYFYQNIPFLSDESVLMMALTTLAESLWGTGDAYRILDHTLDQDMRAILPAEHKHEEDSLMQMELMQKRYDFENQLMDLVSRGLWHRTRLMLSTAISGQIEQRLADPLRNQKNYCIICNTLLRKAAEKGGVHPLHLDRVSSHYALQIELLSDVRSGQNLILVMAQTYCRLVRQHSLKNYSPLIRKTITYIDAEIASDLRLTKLAKLHNVSPEYLSTLFHRETGKTLTQFVNEKRLTLGAGLLRNTALQVQTIAEYCGFPDAGYFAKLFKRHYGMSPKAFREA